MYALKKLTSLLISLLIIITLTFVLMKMIPGDPFMQEQSLPMEIHETLKEHYGLNDPLWKQYLLYLKASLFFDFGPSLTFAGRTVNRIIFESFPVSARLGLEALALAIPIGLLVGIVAALRQRHWQDWSTMALAAIGISTPSFILATLLQYVFAIKGGLFPVARWESFAHTVLPAVSLAALPAAFIGRLMRAQMIEIMRQDYIKTAKSKGLSPLYILFRHALPNAFIPLLGYLGQLFANVLTGSFIVEKIYGIPGLGYWFIASVLGRDYTLIMGITVFYSAILLLAIFLCDLCCRMLDPRLRRLSHAS
jgi:oligopeptide transport system permease protein